MASFQTGPTPAQINKSKARRPTWQIASSSAENLPLTGRATRQVFVRKQVGRRHSRCPANVVGVRLFTRRYFRYSQTRIAQSSRRKHVVTSSRPPTGKYNSSADRQRSRGLQWLIYSHSALLCFDINRLVAWHSWSLTGELSLSYARPTADGRSLM